MKSTSFQETKGEKKIIFETNWDFACISLALFSWFFIHIFRIFRFGMTIEAVHEGIEVQQGFYIGMGRWGIALWRALFGGYGYMPWISGAISGLAIAISCLILIKLFRLASKLSQVVFIIMMTASPVFMHHLNFSPQADVIGIAILAATGAIWFLSSNFCVTKSILAALLMSFSMGTYQMTVFVIGAIWGIWYLSTIIIRERKFKWRTVGRFLGISLISVIIYFSIATILQHTQLASKEELSIGAWRGASYFHWDLVKSAPFPNNFFILCHFAVTQPLKNILGLNFEGQWGNIFVLIPVAYIIFYIARTRNNIGYKLWSILFVLVALYATFSISLIFINPVSHMLYMGEPILIAGLWGVFLSNVSHAWIKKAAIILVSILFISAAYRSTVDAQRQRYRHERSLLQASIMYARAAQVAETANLTQLKIRIVGVPFFGLSPNQEDRLFPQYSASTSHLPYVGWSHQCFERFPRYYGIHDFKAATAHESRIFAQFCKFMPIYPSPGSIKAIGDTVVIKVGELL